MKKRLLIGFIFIVIIGAGVIIFRKKPSPNPFLISSVKRGSLKVIIKGRGEILPAKTYKIISLVSGVIDDIFVKEGDRVKEKELLLTIDKTELFAKLKEIEKNIILYCNKERELKEDLEVERLEKGLFEAKISFEDAKTEHEKLNRLYELKAISEQELLNSQSQLKKNEASLKLIEKELFSAKRKRIDEERLISSQLKEQEAYYNWIKKQISWTDVISPIEGIIVEKNPDLTPNYLVSQGTYLFTVASFSYKIKALIDEVDIGKVSIGDRGIIRIDAYPYQPIKGFIKKISPQPIISAERPGIRNFEVELEGSFNIKIAPKMQCSVEIEKVLNNVLKVDLEDVIEEEGKRYVFVIKEGKAKRRMIKTGIENENEVEVLSGIGENEMLIRAPSDIKEGTRVIQMQNSKVKMQN